MARKGKPSQGRKKIEIKRIESEEARHVCFSKRRIGVFTKASELSTMCGAQVAIVVNSPSGTPYSFGSPSVYAVVNSFLSQSPVAPLSSAQSLVINKLNKDYMEVCEKLTAEKQKAAMLDERAKEASKSKDFELIRNMNKLGLDDLNQLLASYAQARNTLTERISFLESQAHSAGFVNGMAGNYHGVFQAMAQSTLPPPPPPPVSSSGTIVELMNYAPNPYAPGSF